MVCPRWAGDFADDEARDVLCEWDLLGGLIVSLTTTDAIRYSGLLPNVAGTPVWEGYLVAGCPVLPPPSGTRTCWFSVDFSSPHAEDYMRNYVDEIDQLDHSRVSHWAHGGDDPPFRAARRVHGSSNIWTSQHERGLVRKLNSVSATRYAPSTTSLYI